MNSRCSRCDLGPATIRVVPNGRSTQILSELRMNSHVDNGMALEYSSLFCAVVCGLQLPADVIWDRRSSNADRPTTNDTAKPSHERRQQQSFTWDVADFIVLSGDEDD